MPRHDALNSSQKRQAPGECLEQQDQQQQHGQNGQHEHAPKRLKRDPPPPAFWDNLSKIWLTNKALKEFDRRNKASNPSKAPFPSQRPLTRQLFAKLQHHNQLPTLDLTNRKPETLKELKRFAKGGGPDLSDIRGFPEPQTLHSQPMLKARLNRDKKRRAESPPPDGDKANTKSTRTSSTKTTSVYTTNFEQNLIENGVYVPRYVRPDGEFLPNPSNWDEINERLARRRSSLSPSRYSESEHRKLLYKVQNAKKEELAALYVIPALEGEAEDSSVIGRDHLFGNLAPLTDGTLAMAKPDYYFGARPEQLLPPVRNDLNKFIVPSSQCTLPVAPNFFLELKGPDGNDAVVTRQACYDAALGARGMHKLQNYRQHDKPLYDNQAYTISATYQGGTLKLYTTHLAASPVEGRPPEYIMTPLDGWYLLGNIRSFREGVSAYRNAQDWAKEQRNEFIKAANKRYTQARARKLKAKSSTDGAISKPATALGDSDTPATSNKAKIPVPPSGSAQPGNISAQPINGPTRPEKTPTKPDNKSAQPHKTFAKPGKSPISQNKAFTKPDNISVQPTNGPTLPEKTPAKPDNRSAQFAKPGKSPISQNKAFTKPDNISA